MSRRFLRPLFSFWDPILSDNFLPKKAIPGGSKARKMYERTDQRREDPHETFDSFFKDQYEDPAKLRKEERQFFEKHYPERVGKKLNPYEVLGVDEKADMEKIKEAYRTNAIKYHPKNDNTEEGKRKFSDLSRAYNELINTRRTNDYGQDVSRKSLFQDFHNRMKDFDNQDKQDRDKNKITGEKLEGQQETKMKDQSDQMKQTTQGQTGQQEKNEQQQQKSEKNVKQSKSQEDKSNMKQQQKIDDSLPWWQRPDSNKPSKSDERIGTKEQSKQDKKNFLKGAELYSESSYFEFIDGKRKLHVTKMYQKDGKTLKVDRIEGSRPDGTIEVTETLDDGNEVKHNKYVQGSSRNQNERQLGQ